MPTIDLPNFLALLGLTVGLGILISLAIHSAVKRRWDEQDAKREMDELRQRGANRYTA